MNTRKYFWTIFLNLFKNVILIVFRETEHKGQESPVISTKKKWANK